jgi:hypothetical protein
MVINMTKWGGLSNTGNSIKLISTTNTRIVDRVEYGSIATSPENTLMSNAANPASGQEIYRNGHADTNMCAADFLSRAQTIVRDTTAPTSSVDAISPYWKNTSPLTITATAADTGGSTVAYVQLWYRYAANNATWGAWTQFANDTASPWSFSFTFPGGNGYYQFYTRAGDAVGNYEAAPGAADQICGYDNVAPASSVTTISPYWRTTSPITVVATGTDATSGIANIQLWYRYAANNATWGAWTQFGTADTVSPYEWSFNFPSGNGYYEFYSRATDRATNYEAAPGTRDALCAYDNVAPTITATTIADNAIDQAITAGVYEATWSEAMAAVGSVTTNLPGATFSWPSTTVYRITYTALAYSTVYTITYNGFTDVATNAATGDLAKQFTTIAAPSSTATITGVAPASPSKDNTPEFTYTVTNAPTSAEFYWATVPGGPYTLWGTDSPATSPWTPATGIADGTYYFAARGIGATSEPVPTAAEWGPYVIDTVGPTITATTIADNAVGQAITAGVYEATWSEAMAAVGSVTTNLPGATFSWPSTTVYRITYTALAYSTVYTITYNGFTDVATNAATGDLAKQFTTMAAPPVLTTITVTPDPVSLDVGTFVTVTAQGRDQYGATIACTPVWADSTASGTFSLITPGNPATARYTAGASLLPLTVDAISATDGAVVGRADLVITYTPALFSIVITPDPISVGTSASIGLTAQGYDQFGAAFACNPTWADLNGGGSFVPATGTATTYTAGAVAGSWIDAIRATDGSINGYADLTITSAGGDPPTTQVNTVVATPHTNGGADIQLEWTEIPDATLYNIYESTSVRGTGFNFGTPTYVVPGDGVGKIIYQLTGKYADSSSYSWIVRAANANGENTVVPATGGNMGYKLVKDIIRGTGAITPQMNYVALPMKMNLSANTAAGLRTDMRTYGAPINSINSIGRWNANTGLWEVRTGVGTNFNLMPGEAYRIDPVTGVNSVIYKIVGAHDNSTNAYNIIRGTGSITPQMNYISLPYHYNMGANDAASLRTNMRTYGTPTNSINSIGRWNANTGLWEVRTGVGTNFVLTPGEGYRVDPVTGVNLVTWSCPLKIPSA